MNKVIYFGYYLRETDWKELSEYLAYLGKTKGHGRIRLLADAARSTFKYNVALMDYFYFRFFEKDPATRDTYAGTGFMYEFHREMNPLDARDILQNKLKFLDAYAGFIKHEHCTVDDVENDTEAFARVLAATRDRLVLKDSLGQCGWGVDVVDDDMDRKDLLELMKKRGYDLVEQYVDQHPELAALSSSGLNTVRIVTILDDQDEVHILGAALRMSISSFVDNIAMGNIAAPIDLDTGRIASEVVFKDIRKAPEARHPVSGKDIVGFQIPHWERVLEMIRVAALHNRSNRSIGWDIAITSDGPSLIEGNHNWCKLFWQLPCQRGLKSRILEFYRPN